MNRWQCTYRTVALRTLLACVASFFLVACNHRSLEFKQVYTGGNGVGIQEQIGTQYFLTRAELDRSWVKGALGTPTYDKLFATIDFSRQAVVAYSEGETEDFSGTLEITDVYQYTGVDSLPMNMSVSVGIRSATCRTGKKSFPFALAVFELPSNFALTSSGLNMRSVDGGCPKG